MTAAALISTTPPPQAAIRQPSPEPILTVEQLVVTYRDVIALEDISFQVQRGESVAIIGPNGAGKSTLLKSLLGLLPVQSGQVTLHPPYGRTIGYVPQHEGVNLDFPVTVRDVVMMGRVRQIGWLRFPGRRDWQAVDAALARVGLSDLSRRQIGELSGGQRRRAFIARALAQDVEILFLDEPLSGIDAGAQGDFMETLAQLSYDGLTILMTTHDLELAFRRFDRVMALRRKLIAFGDAQTIYRPEVLAQLYERAVTTWGDHGPITMIVDEHGCDGC
jgi:ABC-type Mn2+/Zn2+ transport system ATPase subunit